MTPRGLDIGYSDVLEGWIQGRSVSELAQEHEVDPVQLTSFIEDFFGYKLPWGMSGYLRIAQHALEWERVPEHLAALPLLVRYGVPSVHAAWLMSLGSPSRSVAVRLADRFRSSGREHSMRALRRWLGNLNLEDLTGDFGSSPGRLEAASRMITRADGNGHLRDFYRGADLFPLEIGLRIRFREGANDVEARLLRGETRIDVQRDYESPYRNAMRIHIPGVKPIRLRREYADVLALEADAGRAITASVADVARQEDVVTLQLTIRDSADSS
jgi:hypothetical protein